MSALLAVQDAVFDKLSGDATLLALATGGVHDHVLQGTPKPYLVVGREPTKIPDDTHSTIGYDTTMTVHGWSEAEGNAEVALIMGRVDVLLNKQPLTVAGYTAWSVENEFETLLVENDGDRVLRHAVSRYRIQLQG